MTDTTPVGIANSFPGAVFGWLYTRPISFLARWSRPLSVLLNVRRYECLWLDLALLLFAGEGFSELLEDSLSSDGISASLRMMGFFLLSRTVWCLAYPLSYVSPLPRLCLFFYLGPEMIVFTQ